MHELAEKYKLAITTYEDYKVKIEGLLKEILLQNTISFHKIESRVKDPLKLDEKIIRKNAKYNTLNDITDLIGLRVITYFEDEVDKVADVIARELVIDTKNSIDKRNLEADRFGYKSLHYVASLPKERQKLIEYKRFGNRKFEIQIRSILQHAWAEIEHDIGYKGELQIPETLKRDFYRIAALLETSDLEFVRLKNELKHYEENIGEQIKSHPEEVEINSASLKSYILNSPIVLEIDKELTTANDRPLADYAMDMDFLLPKLSYLKIISIKHLDQLLKQHRNALIWFSTHWLKARQRQQIKPKLGRGVSIFYLAYILAAQLNNEVLVGDFFSKTVYDSPSRKEAKEILQIYEKITNN